MINNFIFAEQYYVINSRSKMPVLIKLFRSFVWLVALFVVGWPISLFITSLYLFLLPVSVFLPAIHEYVFLLRKGYEIPRFFAENVLKSQPLSLRWGCKIPERNPCNIFNCCIHSKFINYKTLRTVKVTSKCTFFISLNSFLSFKCIFSVSLFYCFISLHNRNFVKNYIHV